MSGLTASEKDLLGEAMTNVSKLTREQLAIVLIDCNEAREMVKIQDKEIERLREYLNDYDD